MIHQVYTGPFAGLERRWLEEVARLQADDPLRPVPVLVGSNILASYLKILLAQRRPVANLRFYTFLDLANALARHETPSRPRLPRLGGITILDELLETDVPEVFKAVAAYPGFRSNLLDTFRDLRDAGMTPADFERSLTALQRQARDRAVHLNGFATLWRRFRAQAERFHDVDDDFRSAIGHASRAAAVLGSRQLLVYGIYDATGQQCDLLASLRETLELTFFIPFVDQAESRFAQAFLDARRAELAVAPERCAEPAGTATLDRLGDKGFGFRAHPPDDADQGLPADGSIRFVSAPGQSRAAVEIVREILTAVRDGTASGFHEIAVLFRHPLEEASVVAEALRLRGIPYFLHGGEPFEQRALCRAVLAVAGLEAGQFARAGVLAAMEFVAAALPPARAGRWDAQHWRALTGDARFLAGADGWDTGVDILVRDAKRALARAESGAGDRDSGDTEAVMSPPRARIRLERAQSLRDAWHALRAASFGWPSTLSWNQWAALLEDRLEPLVGDAEAWPAFSSVVDELRSLGALSERRRIPRGRMVSLLRESIRGHSLTEGRFLRNGVNLLPLGVARGMRFPVVIVPGLEEGAFPARPRQDPLLLDSERAMVGGLFAKLPLKAQRREEETLLFAMAARSAGKRLVLVTSRLDERTDRERIPSEFFLRVSEAAAGSPITLRDLREGYVPGFRSVNLENPAPNAGQVAVDDGEIRLRLITRNRDQAPAALNALALEQPALLERSRAFARARWTRRLTEFDGRILDPDLTRWVGARIGPSAGQVSATRLEDYVRCPYLFYLKRVVGIEPWEEPEPSRALDPMVRGSQVHAVLEDFVRGLAGRRLFTDALAKLETELLELSRRALDDVRPPGMPDLLWELEQERVDQILREWLIFEREREESGLVPRLLERAFGQVPGQAARPAFRLQAGRYTFEFRGKIDRVDLSDDGRRARVIDYKTGRLSKTMKSRKRPVLMCGEKIQIAVYRGALQRDYPGLEEISGEYLHLQSQDGAVVPCSFDDGMLRAGVDRLGDTLEIVGDGIVHGAFFARTGGAVQKDHCLHCGYLPVCGKDVARRAELKSQDPAVREFQKLVDIDEPWEGA